jgi:NAD(P)-dependent dehydrogenase (short-subunit alcohol dehydrogenase family)
VLGIKAMDLHHALYTASKHAVIGLTKTAALEGAPHGLRVCALCPGAIDTPIHATNSASESEKQKLRALHPLNRLGTPEEVACAVAYLASPEASFLTGVVLTVDGGASL